jgi:hypothetical protein
MIQEHKDYVKDNMLLFTTSRRFNPGELEQIFKIYNAVTGEKKKVTGCARCVTSVKLMVLHHYNKSL